MRVGAASNWSSHEPVENKESMNDTIALQRADREQGAVHVRSDK